jgi:NADH dehydrogenase (ubiquinone) 1 alpha subcomplex subunit 6
MTTLQLAKGAKQLGFAQSPARLYRSIIKEMPRVLTIYDIDIPIPKARQVIRGMMEENAYVRDPRVIEMLIEKGYMELEETLLHYKQRPHLMKILKQHEIPVSGPNRKRLTPNSSIEEQFNRA